MSPFTATVEVKQICEADSLQVVMMRTLLKSLRILLQGCGD